MILLLAACHSPPIDSGHDSAVDSCAPLTLTAAQSWEDADLLGSPPPEGSVGNAGVALGDLDGDGWLDALVVTPSGSLALHNDGAGNLVADGALTVDGAPLPAATGVAIGDLDGDGDLDAWLGRWTSHEDLLLFNDGAGHLSATPMPGTTGESTTGTLGDFDGDGDLDLFVAAYASELDPEKILDGSLTGTGNALYLQAEGGFEAAPLPEEIIDDVSFLAIAFDPDHDGDLDLFLANDYGPFLGRDRLLRNDGAGGFTLADDCDCDLAAFHMGAAVGDLNGSGSPDLYLTDLAGPDLLLNDGTGAFYNASLAMSASVPNEPAHLAAWGTAAVDLDRDGWEDLPMVFGALFPGGDPEAFGGLGHEYEDYVDGADQLDVVLVNQGGTSFEDQSVAAGFQQAGVGRALAVGDLDNDGDPDLLTAGLWYATQWRTEGGCTAGLTLRLSGEGLIAGLGAHVIATIGDRTLHRWFTGASTWSSHAPELVLGLGEATQVDLLRVLWTDRRTDSWTDLAAGSVVELAP